MSYLTEVVKKSFQSCCTFLLELKLQKIELSGEYFSIKVLALRIKTRLYNLSFFRFSAKSQIYQRDNFAQRRGNAAKTLQDYEKFREMREIQKVIEELEAEKKKEQSKTEPAGTDIAEDPKEPEVLPVEPETSGTSEALEEIQATNEMIATVKSLFRNPPTPEEKQEHQRLLGNLKDNQKRAVGCLGEIVKDMFKGRTSSNEPRVSFSTSLRKVGRQFVPSDNSSQATIRPKRQFVPSDNSSQIPKSDNSSQAFRPKTTIRPICKKRQFVPNCLIDQLITNLLKVETKEIIKPTTNEFIQPRENN